MTRKTKEKPRNSGTMTESAFWGWIRSALRNRSVYWKPKQECLQKAKRKNQSANKRLKWEYQCNICKKWFPQKEVEVDHIIECGSFNRETAGEFINNLFCEIDNLQAICKNCHKKKTHDNVLL